jgi:hypothetical protein
MDEVAWAKVEHVLVVDAAEQRVAVRAEVVEGAHAGSSRGAGVTRVGVRPSVGVLAGRRAQLLAAMARGEPAWV